MLISGLSAVADKYDALLCDVWGVLHNGREAYPGVVETLSNFQAKGGHVLLLSNAPRPSTALPQMFERLGIPHDVYNGILTSGDAARTYLASKTLGEACYYIGPDRDLNLYEGTGVARVGEAEGEFVLVTGPFDDETEGPEDYRAQFERLVARKLPLICANPDIVVERGDKHIYCAGAGGASMKSWAARSSISASRTARSMRSRASSGRNCRRPSPMRAFWRSATVR